MLLRSADSISANTPRLLDLFCCAGGAAKGYQRSGFHVTGVDHRPQKRYCGDAFILGDALEYLRAYGDQYDAIHASPPCQAYSVTRNLGTRLQPKLIPIVRELLLATGKPYVIENVTGAMRQLRNPLLLCGTMFGLLVVRHRYFEIEPMILLSPMKCHHYRPTVKQGRRPDRDKHFACVVGNFGDVAFARRAMGIDWMTQRELAQAIPPAYTQFIGEHLWKHLAKTRQS